MGSKVRGSSRITDTDLFDQQQRYDQSGKTASAFCEAEGIAVSTFYQRRARLKQRARAGRAEVAKRAAPFIDAGTALMLPPARARMPSPRAREAADRVEVRIELGCGVVLQVTRS
jgi:hypothetical protein